MNLVGKIFIVLIFVMTLVWMAFAVAITATHKSWRETVLRTPDDADKEDKDVGLQYQLKDEQMKNLKLRNVLSQMEDELKEEKALKTQSIASLETELREREFEVAILEKEVEKKKIENGNLLVATSSVTKLALILRNEVDGSKDQKGLREALVNLQNERDYHYSRVLNLTDKLNQEKGKLWRIRQLNKSLLGSVSQLKKVLNHVGVNPNMTLPPRVAPQVRGLVRRVDESGKVIELTIGSDDGLFIGHTMEMFNKRSQYLGRVEIVKVTDDKAVGKVIIHRGKIRIGDFVVTELNKNAVAQARSRQ